MDIEIKNNQTELFDLPKKNSKDKDSPTFLDNMKLPVHRWYRYTAGFSANWVHEVIRKEGKKRILDPFAGSGTVLIESEFANVESFGIESHPYVYRIAKAKLNWNSDIKHLESVAIKLLETASEVEITREEWPPLITKCYPPEIIHRLESLKIAWQDLDANEDIKDMIWFAITSILRTTSPVGTAQWQYIQPEKRKGKVIDVYTAFKSKIKEMLNDMAAFQNRSKEVPKATILNEDARNIIGVPDNWADLIITSPPYANNYDYADAMRLEMTFWGDIQGWGDLQDTVRQGLVRACTQHVANLKHEADEMLGSSLLEPIQEEFNEVYNELATVRLTKGGKKNYHLMILGYFTDLAKIFIELRRVSQEGVRVCFVIGDSAPYGVYVPVDRWLGELALNAGFNSYEFEKIRDRNIKWKNRKHRVPLKEGRLWING